MQHLNSEEKQAIKCEDYQDIFYLKGDSLTCITIIAYEINTLADTAPVNVRPYRPPKKHKMEVNRQIKEMLKGKIIRTSISQWNAYLLVVPKKADTSEKPKSSSRFPEAKQFNNRRLISTAKHHINIGPVRKRQIFYNHGLDDKISSNINSQAE